MSISFDAIRDVLDSAIPCTIATVSADGTPNVTYVSHAEYIDAEHLALSFQFFNKTRENILARPRAVVYISDSESGASYRFSLIYLRTELDGPLFERMKARLAGIASHTGMADVFKLRGADIYRVLGVEIVPGVTPLPVPPRRKLLAALRHASTTLAACEASFDALLDSVLDQLETRFGIAHAMLLMHDADRGVLYTVASRGYPQSGIGSEIALGDGIIGVAAAQRIPVRIAYATADYSYVRMMRDHLQSSGEAAALATEIPFPGIANVESQLAVPISIGGALRGVLYVESPQPRRFGCDDEDALVALATQLGLALEHVATDEEAEAGASSETRDETAPAADGGVVTIRRYVEDDSVFIDDSYLIKGVAGAIIWKLLGCWQNGGRNEFSNRELRLDPMLRLPEVSDNLEARLVLLNRRLAERCDFVRIEKTGRGRFRLCVTRPVRLTEIARASNA